MLNHEEIKRDHSEKGDWKIFDKINRTIAFNVLFAKKEKLYPACVLKAQIKS